MHPSNSLHATPVRPARRALLGLGLQSGLNRLAAPLVLACAGSVLLSGCGFKPRGLVDLTFSVVYIQAPSASAFASELRRNLRANRIDIASRIDDAPVRFDLLLEAPEREITALSTAGRPREYQVRLRLRWQVRDAAGRMLIAPTEMVLRRTITVLDVQGQINPEEEALVLRDMRTDAASQVVRRMAVIRLP